MSNPVAFTVWFTGLPGSGKQTVAHRLAERLRAGGLPVELLGGGAVRRGPFGGALGFTPAGRAAHQLRLALSASLLAKHGVVAIVTSVSPDRALRDTIRSELGAFVEVYVATPPGTCVDRDTDGTWARALSGKIRGFTGVDAPYEAPQKPEVRLDLSRDSVERAAQRVLDCLRAVEYIGARRASGARAGAPDAPDHASELDTAQLAASLSRLTDQG